NLINRESYDQVAVPADIIGDQAAYLQPEMEVTISLHEGVPLAIELPPKAVLEVVETEPAMKGQTAASSYKPALLSNGVRTMVPPFVTTGTKIVLMPYSPAASRIISARHFLSKAWAPVRSIPRH